MADQRFISLADLPGWLAELAASRAVFAPRREGGAVVYRRWTPGTDIELKTRPTESAKHVVFPRAEELFRFRRENNPETGGRCDMSLREAEDPGDAVVFGALSCDARGFFTFDPVYDGSGTQGQAKDTYYLKRREKTLFIVKACRNVLSTCFCHWVGSGPADAGGADVLATDVEGGLVLVGVTKAGEGLLASSKLVPATEAQLKAAEEAHAEALAALGPAPDISTAPPSLLSVFDNMPFWLAQSAGCISCGACTYLCPTCYCFNITDETTGLAGTRLRSWDTCMSALFTLEASGHNPRNGKAARLKNRVGHKFSYYPELHGGRFACCGCGRCIKSCPSSIDIRRIVQNSIAAGGAKESRHG